jgi:hypothetical protein
MRAADALARLDRDISAFLHIIGLASSAFVLTAPCLLRTIPSRPFYRIVAAIVSGLVVLSILH